MIYLRNNWHRKDPEPLCEMRSQKILHELRKQNLAKKGHTKKALDKMIERLGLVRQRDGKHLPRQLPQVITYDPFRCDQIVIPIGDI